MTLVCEICGRGRQGITSREWGGVDVSHEA